MCHLPKRLRSKTKKMKKSKFDLANNLRTKTTVVTTVNAFDKALLERYQEQLKDARTDAQRQILKKAIASKKKLLQLPLSAEDEKILKRMNTSIHTELRTV